MTQLVIPNVFVNGTVADADPVNQNFDAVRAAVNSIDSTNIGSAGIWASHIKQTTVGQGTFGDSEYRFQQRDATKVPLTIHSTQATPQADIWDVIDSTGALRVWIGPDFVLHANDVDFSSGTITGLFASSLKPTTEAEATFGGSKGYKFLQRDAGEVPLTLEAHASPTGDLFNVKDSTGTKVLWIGAGFQVHMTEALNCSALLMGDQGYIDFGDDGQITTYPAGLGVRLFGACAYDWTTNQLIAKGTSAAIWHVSSGSRPFAAYTAPTTTAGSPFTATEVWYLSQIGSMVFTQPASVGPYIAMGAATQAASAMSMGLLPGGGFYIGFGAYYSYSSSAWIATAGTASILAFGYVPGFSGYNVLWTNDSGLTVGAAYSPTFTQGIGMGANNSGAVVAPFGVQTRGGGINAGNGPVLWGGNAAPSNTLGSSGDYYFRTNSPGTSNQRIYVNNGGTWTGIA